MLRRPNLGLWLSASRDKLTMGAHGTSALAGFIDIPQSSVAGCVDSQGNRKAGREKEYLIHLKEFTEV